MDEKVQVLAELNDMPHWIMAEWLKDLGIDLGNYVPEDKPETLERYEPIHTEDYIEIKVEKSTKSCKSMSQLRKVIKEYLWASGMRQEHFAQKVGITNGHLYNIFNGRYTLGIDTAYQMSKILNINPHELIKMSVTFE